jgi:hypothetical protein
VEVVDEEIGDVSDEEALLSVDSDLDLIDFDEHMGSK